MSTAVAVLKGGRPDPFLAIQRAEIADSTKTQYTRALQRYFRETKAPITDADALASHAITLPRSGRAFLKAAVRLYTEGMALAMKGQATPENVRHVQAALYRIEALQNAVPTSNGKGVKAHTWLSQAEVRKLRNTCGEDICGRRDHLALWLLVGAGLRREEAVKLRFDDVKLQPVGDRFRAVLAVRGKGAKDRVVPISNALASAIDAWSKVVGGEGYVLRSLGMDRQLGECISGQGLYDIVAKRGAMMGKPDLQPHDLRRTFAQLGHDAGVSITQLSRLLGHASIATTQRYLNLDLDLETTVSDFVPFE